MHGSVDGFNEGLWDDAGGPIGGTGGAEGQAGGEPTTEGPAAKPEPDSSVREHRISIRWPVPPAHRRRVLSATLSGIGAPPRRSEVGARTVACVPQQSPMLDSTPPAPEKISAG
jgi:hypothetical protein